MSKADMFAASGPDAANGRGTTGRTSGAAGVLGIIVLSCIAVLAAIAGLIGLATRGLTLFAAQASYSGRIIFALLAFGVLLALVALHAWWRRSPAPGRPSRAYRYGAPLRMLALGAMGLYAAAAIALVTGVLQYDLVAAGPVERGHTGVAVGGFDAGSPGPDSGALSAVIARSLRKEVQANPVLAGRVTVLSARGVSTPDQARSLAAANDVQVVIWGQAAAKGFVPSVEVFEPSDYQLWYGDVPEPHDAPLTGDRGLQLDEMAPERSAGFVDYIAGLVHLLRGDGNEAARSLRAAIDALAPGAGTQQAATPAPRTLAAAYVALGRAQESAGNGAAAPDQYRRALGQDSHSAAAHIGLGNLSYRAGDCGTALDEYGQAVRLAPQLSLSWYSRGNAYYCLKRYSNAAADYRAALRLERSGADPANVYHLVLGVTLCQSGRTADGLAELTRAREGNLVLSADSGTQSCMNLAETIAKANEQLAAASRPPAPTATAGATAKAESVAREVPATPWSVLMQPFLIGGTAKTPTPTRAVTRGPVQLPPLFVGPLPSATPTPAPAGQRTAAPATPTLSDSPVPVATDTAAPTLTSAPPARTPRPSSTPSPRLSATSAPPTSTRVPPTSTPAPSATRTVTPLPTSTPVPPTATRMPPTATAVPPTATAVPPTAIPPTETPAPTAAPATATPQPAPTSTLAPTAAAPANTPTPAAPATQPPTGSPGKGKHPTKTPKP